MVEQLKKEIKIMYGLHYPNIIKLYNHYEDDEYVCLILECAANGQLWQKLVKMGRFDEKIVQKLMGDISINII